MTTPLGIGIDIAKHKVDVASSTGWSATFPQTQEGLLELAKAVAALNPHRVLLEASGGYERAPLLALYALSCPVVLLEPARVRAFARSQRRRAKTDAIDARILAHMAQVGVDDDPLWQPLGAELEGLRELVTRRQAVLGIIDGEVKRQMQASSSAIKESIERVLAVVRAEQKLLEKQLNELIAGATQLKEKAAVLESVKGVGRTTAATLLVAVPELGRLSREEVAALVGVAPMNQESGTWTGKRRTQGGRAWARRALYMATLTATVHNEHISAYYKELKKRGKASKVAIVACMRKLLIHMNSLVRKHEIAQRMNTPTPGSLAA